MSDTEERTVAVDGASPVETTQAAEAAEPAETTQVTQVTQAPPAQMPPTQATPRTRGWLLHGWHWGIFAGIMVVVAAAFFTIGWFASDHGGYDRQVMRRGFNQQQMPMRQWQGYPGQRGNGQQAPSTPQTPQTTPSTQQSASLQKAYLGVGVETVTPQLQQQYGLTAASGAVVFTIDGNGPAVGAGVRQGDVITAIDGTAVTTAQQVVSSIGAKKSGETVSLMIDRAGQSLTIQVTLGTRAAVVG